MTEYVLDTSALLALYGDEDGADEVEAIFEKKARGEASVSVSHMTIYELLYLTMSRSSPEESFSFLFRVRAMGMQEIWPDEDLLWRAALLKSGGGMSVADSFIAASALSHEATLVHKDSEFDRLPATIKTLRL